MKKGFTILLAVGIVLSLAACQETPEKEIVIPKDMEQMIEKAAATDAGGTPGGSLKERVGASETFVFANEKDNFMISANAPIHVPDADRIPIVRVKAGEFSQEQVTAYWDALVGDTVMYEPQTQMTKSEIEEFLINYRKAIAEREHDPDYEQIIEQTKATIAYLESLHPKAPEVIERKPADSTLKRIENRMWGSEKVYGWYMGASGNAEDDATGFRVENMLHDDNGETYNKANMNFSKKEANYNYGQTGTIEVDENTQLDDSLRQRIKITPAEAKALVEDLLAATGTPMAVYGMKLVNDEETGVFDGIVAPAEHYAYSISCIRMVDGVLPCARITGSTYVDETDGKPVEGGRKGEFVSGPGIEEPTGGYMKHWYYEELSFMAGDSGIISMNWRAPLELLETKVEDSALMPFSEIQSVFEKMMRITYEAQAAGLDNLTCEISEISLEMMRVVEQGSIENGLLIPVWNFYGVRSRTYQGETDDTGKYILLCVNAIDGSVIDTSKGY